MRSVGLLQAKNRLSALVKGLPLAALDKNMLATAKHAGVGLLKFANP